MTTYAAHLRISAIGAFEDASGAAVDIFSYGLSMGHPGSSADADPAAVLTILEDSTFWPPVDAAFRAFHATANLHISPQCVLQMVKIAGIGADGTYLGPPVELVSNTPGGGTGNTYPSQVALCMTQDGPAATHRQHGRFYAPGIGDGLDTDWRMPASQQAQALTAQHTLVTALNTAAGSTSFRVVIASQKGSGHNVLVEQLRVGRVYDTQRRRRNALEEDYAAVAV